MQPKIFGRRPQGEALTKIQRSPNYYNGSFRNPIPTNLSVNPIKVFNDYFKRESGSNKPNRPVPIQYWSKNNTSKKPSIDLSVRWLGHASSMIEIEGFRILTDPVLSERVSPFPFAGPKRMHPNPLSLDDFPDIDLILISHNHYDHLDYELICNLKDRPIKYIVPLGVGESLLHWGILQKNITELDWHESIQFSNDLKIIATPARHFTGRGILDRNKAHWASFILKGKDESVFFCGDSGFFGGFEDIGNQYGPFDITMIGIGAYNKQWQDIHTNPEEAIKAHQLLKGKFLLPIHWCTFDLALHTWQEPIEWLVKEAFEKQVQLIVPIIGEKVKPTLSEQIHWWRG